MCAAFKDCAVPCPLSESQSRVVSVALQLVLADQEGLANLVHPVFINIIKHLYIQFLYVLIYIRVAGHS